MTEEERSFISDVLKYTELVDIFTIKYFDTNDEPAVKKAKDECSTLLHVLNLQSDINRLNEFKNDVRSLEELEVQLNNPSFDLWENKKRIEQLFNCKSGALELEQPETVTAQETVKGPDHKTPQGQAHTQPKTQKPEQLKPAEEKALDDQGASDDDLDKKSEEKSETEEKPVSDEEKTPQAPAIAQPATEKPEQQPASPEGKPSDNSSYIPKIVSDHPYLVAAGLGVAAVVTVLGIYYSEQITEFAESVLDRAAELLGHKAVQNGFELE